MALVFNPNNTARHFEISWIPVVRRVIEELLLVINGYMLLLHHQRGIVVTNHTVRVVSDAAFVGQGSTTCTTSPCLYVQQVAVFATKYTIFVAIVNRDGGVAGEDSTTIYGEYHILSYINYSCC